MASGIVLKARRGMAALPLAVTTDVPVLALLIVAWLTVPLFWAHLTVGLALVALIAVHLLTRRRRPLSVGSAARRLAYAWFLAAAAAMAVTGLLRWAGLPPEQVWHGGISYLVLGFAAVHLWSIRRVLWARLRTAKQANWRL